MRVEDHYTSVLDTFSVLQNFRFESAHSLGTVPTLSRDVIFELWQCETKPPKWWKKVRIFRCVFDILQNILCILSNSMDFFGRTWRSMANTPTSSSREPWIFMDPLMEFGTTTSSPAWITLVSAQATRFHLFGKVSLKKNCLQCLNVDRAGDGSACTATHGLTCVLTSHSCRSMF